MDNEEERLAFYQSINGIKEIVGKPNDVRRVNSVHKSLWMVTALVDTMT